MLQIQTNDNKTFEGIKHIDENGVEYWLARELCPVLQYKQWRRFENAINRAKEACQRSKHEIADHFADVGKMIEMPTKPRKDGKIGFANAGKTKVKTVLDYKMTRYACYLTVMNGDPRKEIIALGQTYFAVKTRQQEYQELFNQLTEDDRRLFLRSDIKHKNMLLAEAAKRAGVQMGFEYAEFQDFGYKGLYGGLTAKEIAGRKNLDHEKQEILDYMGSTELAANLFRITQTEEVMRQNQISTPDKANATHYRVGSIVREAIVKAGTTLPENLPTPKKSAREIESERIRKIKSAEKPKRLKYKK